MLKTVLVGINAKFIHTCLAVYSLRAYCPGYANDINIREFTINQDRGWILRELYACMPEIIGFSCYIWNIEMVAALANSLKKLLPNLIILLGGPEVSYGDVECPADVIVKGEGEQSFLELLDFYNGKRGAYPQIAAGQADMGRLRFPYTDGFDGFANRIIYYESSRGCPFQCQYCLSGGSDSQVRILPLDRVYGEMKIFLNARVKQVKFVDRTFNCLKDRAAAIWRFLKENDNGATNFHFEISADLLDDEALELLSGVRKGQFQFEIGVQSTNESVLSGVRRHTDIQRLTENVSALRGYGNIHIHLDLIAGLPGEGYLSFRRSFNDVYAMKPDMLQLGFLKALKGSGLRENAALFGLVHEESPPYEVLRTNDLSFSDICALKDVEALVEGYNNTGLAPLTLRYLTQAGAFGFYEGLARHWRDNGHYSAPLGKMGMYAVLYAYCLDEPGIDADLALELMRFDLLERENEKNPPEWLVPKPSPEARALCRAYRKSMGADAFAIQVFEYDIAGWQTGLPIKRRNTVLFRYKNGKGRGAFCEIQGIY